MHVYLNVQSGSVQLTGYTYRLYIYIYGNQYYIRGRLWNLHVNFRYIRITFTILTSFKTARSSFFYGIRKRTFPKRILRVRYSHAQGDIFFFSARFKLSVVPVIFWKKKQQSAVMQNKKGRQNSFEPGTLSFTVNTPLSIRFKIVYVMIKKNSVPLKMPQKADFST